MEFGNKVIENVLSAAVKKRKIIKRKIVHTQYKKRI